MVLHATFCTVIIACRNFINKLISWTSLKAHVRPLFIIIVERDYLRGAIVWSHL